MSEEYDTTEKVITEIGAEKVLESEQSGKTKKLENVMKEARKQPLPVRWKEKLTHMVRFATRLVEKRTGIKMANEDQQEIANEWSGLLEEYGIQPPKFIRLAMAVVITLVIVLNTYWSVIEKMKFFRSKKDELRKDPEKKGDLPATKQQVQSPDKVV